MKTEPISIRIESDTLKHLKKRANKERRTLSGIINYILAEERDKELKSKA